MRCQSQVTRLSIGIEWQENFWTGFSEEALLQSETRLWPDTMVLLACICAACSADLQSLTFSTCLIWSEPAARASLLVKFVAAVACILDKQS